MRNFRAINVLIFSLFILYNCSSFTGNGRIFEVNNDENMSNIIVKVHGNGTFWVGCTVFPSGFGKYGVDLDAQKVRGGSAVKFKVLPGVDIGESRLDYVVGLWEDKIDLRECERKYGKGSHRCQWARKNGYQMEGLLDRKQGTFTPNLD